MSVNDCNPNERTDTNRNGPRPKYIDLGMDQTGASHTYRTTDSTIVVVREGERILQRRLAPGELDNWMDYVDDERSWDRQRYGVDLVDRLQEGL